MKRLTPAFLAIYPKNAGADPFEIKFSAGSDDDIDVSNKQQALHLLNKVEDLKIKSANEGWGGSIKDSEDLNPGEVSVFIHGDTEGYDPKGIVSSIVESISADYTTKEGIKPKSPRFNVTATRLLDNQLELDIVVDNVGAEKGKLPSKTTIRMNASDLKDLNNIGFVNEVLPAPITPSMTI